MQYHLSLAYHRKITFDLRAGTESLRKCKSRQILHNRLNPTWPDDCNVETLVFFEMSGSRLTRKVTVEGSKKISDGNAPRKSVFDRLGPGTAEVKFVIFWMSM